MILNDICEFIVDCPHTTAPDEGAGYPLIRTPNIGKGRLVLNGVHRVSEKVYRQRIQRGMPQDDDLIFAREAPAGNVAIVKNGEKVCLGQRTVLLRPDKSKVCPDYLVYYILAPAQQYKLLGTANGATVAHINLPVIRNMPVELPPLEVQETVAGYLSVYDNLIENNQKQIKLLEEAAQRLYKEWFVDLRFPGYEETPIVDGVPEGWKKVGLDSIAPIVTGKKDANFGTPDGKYQFFTCAQEPIKSPSYSFDCDAVILAGNGDFNVKLYRGQFEAYQRTYVFSPYDTDHLYLLYHAVRESMRQLFQGASGSTIKFLTKHMLEDISVYIPEASILQEYNSNCEAIQKKIECLKEQIICSQEARDRLLPKLMSGEIEA